MSSFFPFIVSLSNDDPELGEGRYAHRVIVSLSNGGPERSEGEMEIC